MRKHLPQRLRHRNIRILTCNEPVMADAIVIENINAIYNRERNSIGDTLFNHSGEVLVLSDEVHHAYTHLTFTGQGIGYDFENGREGGGDNRDERLWMKFLREEPGIRRHIGFTGTPYNRNDYFPDVIYNYSIKDARDEKIIKRINPIIRIESEEEDIQLTERQRYEQIILTHQENRETYAYRDRKGRRRVKPVTIFICPTQTKAQQNATAFIQVLAAYMRETDSAYADKPLAAVEQAAGERVICVVSRLARDEYQAKLEQIEETDPAKVGGKVEFIFAVNKLSEGWDVDNVFQIVPSEERVFNSKLLISQVLGRGLRLPRKVTVSQIQRCFPRVTITNHQRFADHIRELLEQVTECELRLASNPILAPDQKRYAHHFALLNIVYLPGSRVVPRGPDEVKENGKPGELRLTPFADKLDLKVVYLEGSRRFELSKELFTVDQVVLELERRFANVTFESLRYDFGKPSTDFDLPQRERIEAIIRRAMKAAGIEGDRLSRHNRKEIELHFNQYLPKGTKKVLRENIGGQLSGAKTTDLPGKSARSGGLGQEISAFLTEDYRGELGPENLFILEEIERSAHPEGPEQLPIGYEPVNEPFNTVHVRRMVPGKHLYAVNPSLFRCPQDLVIVSHEPERLFVFRLVEHGRLIAGWIKSPDTDFYAIDYEYWKGGKDRVRRSFNPDFFIRLNLGQYLAQIRSKALPQSIEKWHRLQDQGVEDLILVVEIKDDDDDSEATRAKGEWGKRHVEDLNRLIRETSPVDLDDDLRTALGQHYAFWILRPAEYGTWFAMLRNGMLVGNL